MNQKATMVRRTLLIGAILCSILISKCLSIGVIPQNSYPLDINFDGHKPIPVNFRSSANAPKLTPYNLQHEIKRNNIATTYQRRSKSIQSTPTSPLSSYKSMSDEAHNIQSYSVQKRTLSTSPNPTSIGTHNSKYLGSINEMVDREFSESQRVNSTMSPEAMKLVQARQKMIDMQGRNVNVSIEDTNWKIAAGCLTNQFGTQFIRNRDVKCAASQIVLSISRMQRAGCKYCQNYFHCEGFYNVKKRCKDNYDVEDTLNVMRDCRGLINADDFDCIEATKAPASGVDCQKKYLCQSNCMYNPTDGTCPRNNCYVTQLDDREQPYRSYIKSRKGRPTNIALPAGSPIRERLLAMENSKSE